MKAEDVEVGMKVRVLQGNDTIESDYSWTPGMNEYVGKVARVTDPPTWATNTGTKRWGLDLTGEDNYWIADWLDPVEPAPKFKVGDRVRKIAGDYKHTKHGEVYTIWKIFGGHSGDGHQYIGFEEFKEKLGRHNDYDYNYEKVEEPHLRVLYPFRKIARKGLAHLHDSVFTQSGTDHKSLLGIDWASPINEKEVKDLEDNQIDEIAKQLGIAVVARDGAYYVLKDGRIGYFNGSRISITLTEAEQQALIKKLPDSISGRAFILEDRKITFQSYEFINLDERLQELEESGNTDG